MFTVEELIREYYPNLSSRPWLHTPAHFFLKYLLKEKEINTFEQAYPHLHGLDFVEQLLEHFHFSYSTRNNEKERIPTQGRLVIIANHPIGSLDGLALIKLISETRKDLKIIANEKLPKIKALQGTIINIKDSTTNNDIEQHLQQEGVIIIFPAQEVSRIKWQGIRDRKWKSTFLLIAINAKAPILPIYIDGKNSPLFYTTSMLCKPLATLLLIREMFKHRTKHLPMRIGEPISFETYQPTNISIQQTRKLLQKHLYRIGHDKQAIFKTQKSIAPPECKQALLHAIKQCKKLGETNDNKEFYLYEYNGCSPILREVGRLREIAFRAIGEGTNKRRDIDQHDNEYFHLILWDKDNLDIVGAYRFGDAKRLSRKPTGNHLYSAQLFNYTPLMQTYFEQGLELGRSFVQPKYWGKRSLDYLWYGIGAFLEHNPQYRYLFGPVSISNSLPDTAKELIIYFYNLYFSSNSILAIANNSYETTPSTGEIFDGHNYKNDFAKLKNLLTNMGVSVPTLYKQYTETFDDDGVQFLAFSIDPDFNYCIDGLILTDLHKIKPKKKQRYMPNQP